MFSNFALEYHSMKSRVEGWERYRARIATAPEWFFPKNHSVSSKHSLSKEVLAGKGVSSKAVSLDAISGKQPKMVGYDAYEQRQKTKMIMKYSLFGIALIVLIVWYVMWVR